MIPSLEKTIRIIRIMALAGSLAFLTACSPVILTQEYTPTQTSGPTKEIPTATFTPTLTQTPLPTVTPTFTPILTFTPTSTSTPTPTPQLLEKCRIIYIELEEPQTIYAAYNCFDGTPVYVIYTTLVSAGLSATPTPTGDFKIFEKIESRAMSGPGYYLEGVPHIMYFKERGYAIHGAYWHNNFGHPMSHGCVNLPLDDAEWFYDWAEVGTLVTIQQDFDDIPFEFYIEE